MVARPARANTPERSETSVRGGGPGNQTCEVWGPDDAPPTLLVARIVRGIDVGDTPGSDTVNLTDGLFAGPDEVTRPGRHDCDAARRAGMGLGGVEGVSHADVGCRR